MIRSCSPSERMGLHSAATGPAVPSVDAGSWPWCWLPVVMWPTWFLFASSRCRVRNRARGLPGIGAAQEQHLGFVYIADAGQFALVEQCLAERAVQFGTEPAYCLGAVPVGAEQIRAKVAGDLRLVAGVDQFHDAELIADGLPVLVGSTSRIRCFSITRSATDRTRRGPSLRM